MSLNIDAKKLVETPWHNLSYQEVMSRLEVDENGLTEEEAQSRLVQFGENKLPEKKPVTLWQIILHQILNPLIFILFAATIASLLIGEYTDAFFILIVVALNTMLGTYQEYKAEKSACALQNMLKLHASVLRNGKKKVIPSELLVPGDIVFEESGSKMPADIRIIEANNLTVDESFLTGESVAVNKLSDPIEGEKSIADRKNLAYAGGTVLSGRSRGIVIATGLSTQVGIIAKHVSTTSSAKPPLVIRMEKFTRNISWIVVGLSFVLAFMLYLQHYDTASIFFFVVALAVSTIPEGLPVALTVVLSIATKRMSQRNVIVRKLNAVESLGSCSVIASDKTGTLTLNQQTVRSIYLSGGACLDVTGQGYNGEGIVELQETEKGKVPSSFDHLLRVALLCNEGKLHQIENGWEQLGDSMDVALLALGYKAGEQPEEYRRTYTLVQEIPYESEKKYAGAIHKRDGIFHVSMKGAVETVLGQCSAQLNREGTIETLNSEAVFNQVNQMAARGLRVLAFAGKQHELDHTLEGLVFYGLVGFIDPLRPEAIEAVKTCKNAGIRVLMITGDHPVTAGAISKELGLTEHAENVISGNALLNQSPEEFSRLVDSSNVFARVSPNQKLEIVDNLIQRGEFVAVTGDGVNDTPALRRANIGVAMGSGTDIAKEVGSMIVVDDNFSSIVAGVEEGRFAFDNVRKVIYLLISTGAAEVILFVSSILAGLPLPLLAVQLLWLNLVTNGIQDVALAFEGGEPGAMKRKPRKTNERIFNHQMIKQTLISGFVIGITVFAVWYYLINYAHMQETEARNIVLLLMVLMQNVHVFNARSELTSVFHIPFSRNYFLIFGVLGAQALHIASMQIPFMQRVLGTQPISPIWWAELLGFALIPLIVMEIAKYFWRKREGIVAN
jgi:magnesium-transporting ATPase (P-type)